MAIALPVAPMLARLTPPPSEGRFPAVPFASKGYAYEVKWDGWRAVLAVTEAGVILYSRPGLSLTDQFPEVAQAALALPVGTVLDGEVIVMKDGRPDFQALQNHRSLTREQRAERLRYIAFDVLSDAGEDVQRRPYTDRKARLEALIGREPGFLVYGTYSTDGQAAWALVEQYGLEGLIAKPLISPYRQNERGPWLKLKRKVVEDFLVVGYEEGKGRRAGTIGSLVLAEPDAKGETHIVGTCGTGFTDATLDMLMERFRPLIADRTEVPRRYVIKVGNAKVVWLRTPLTATVEYAERTNTGGVRGPASFKGLR